METRYQDTGLIWVREHRGSSIAYRVIRSDQLLTEFRLITKTLGATTFSKFPPYEKSVEGLHWNSSLVLDLAGYEFLNCQSYVLSELLELAGLANLLDKSLIGNDLARFASETANA